MSYVISAAPMYEDGSIGDHEETIAGDPLAIGTFLSARADALIGSLDGEGCRCDALDVTVALAR